LIPACNVRRNPRRVTIAVAAAFVASVLGYTVATADSGLSSAEALQRYGTRTLVPYTAGDDYVDTLIWWYNHPGWSI
jgi:hypothetical protein